jgi:hypothetical protein
MESSREPQPVHAWRLTDFSYRGNPVYQSLSDGHMAYEADFQRLVALPDDVEDAFLAVLLADDCLRPLPGGVAN